MSTDRGDQVQCIEPLFGLLSAAACSPGIPTPFHFTKAPWRASWPASLRGREPAPHPAGPSNAQRQQLRGWFVSPSSL